MLVNQLQAQALKGTLGAHDPSTIIKRNGVYHVWTTGNQIQHLTSTDLINWTAASSVFASGTWPSWINNYVSGFAGFFWAPECIYMNGKYYMYYSCSTGARPCAIGVATSTDLTNWTDQGMVIYSDNSSTYGSIDPAVFSDASGNYWMTFGSHLTGIWIAQLNTSTGKRLNSTLKNIAGSNSSEHEGSYVIRNGNYYYLFYNRGICCAGTNSTYYVQMGRSTSPNGTYVDVNGTNLLSGGGTTVMSRSSNFYGTGQIGFYTEGGNNFISYHYYNSNANGAPTLGIANMGFQSSGWPFITRDWIPSGRYKIINKNSAKVWDAWGCTGATNQAIAQGTSSGVSCQQWDFTPLGDGIYKITCALGGLAADVVNCVDANSTKLQLYPSNNTNCQKYRIERAGDGSFVFTSLTGNRVVEVPNASTTAGTQLALFDYNGNNCQKWLLGTAGTAKIGNVLKTEVNEPETSQKILIYPNPASKGVGVTIDLSATNMEEANLISVMDIKGAVLEKLEITNKSSVEVGARLPVGLYIINVTNNTQSITQKVIIK